ncbi:AmpE protein [Pseudoxanthomonas sp. 3HH-4]|uniref:regulatory signaling modulator protein AmpE n=1 Tax=Pseudoxanthomonas sp. 3HH-4 TaxID=1690214 RepID=UPI0011528DC8|nr:regulatory signaling modulator protein AmpE [Pseudoxanthomonas sp. 3HH-4]TQM03670.1 AmpE protein [Pseudoxanthomonas sp. 3HH-4]
MSITLVAVVLALVLGHVAPALVASFRQYAWYGAWLRWLGERSGGAGVWQARYGIVLAMVPVLLVVALLQWMLDGPLYGLPGLLFDIVVLVYAWGPRDLDVDVEAVIDAHDASTRRAAIARLGLTGEAATLDGPALVEAVFVNAMQRWFGVLFWFLLLGPVGAVLYRLSVLATQDECASTLPEENRLGARALKTVLDWPVAQLMTLAMALVGNFDTVFTAWREAGGTRFQLGTGFLGYVARASVRCELAEEAEEYAEEGMVQAMRELPELRDAMSLVWRILLLWLALLAVFVIGGWVS